MGFAVAPPLLPYTRPGQSPRLAVRLLELRSVFHTFPARRSACIRGDIFVSFTDLYVSLPKQSYRVVLLGHLQ